MAYEVVSFATLGENVFNTIFQLINTNKPSGWTVLSAFPENSPTYPCIVIDPAKAKVTIVGMDKNSYIVEDVVIEFEFYAKSNQGKEKIEEGKDNIRNTLLTNQSTLETYNILMNEDAFEDSNNDVLIVGEQKLNTAGCLARFSIN